MLCAEVYGCEVSAWRYRFLVVPIDETHLVASIGIFLVVLVAHEWLSGRVRLVDEPPISISNQILHHINYKQMGG